MTDSRSAVATRELQQLERRRRLLERLIVIARSFETLKRSLESLMHQGEVQSEPRPELLASLDARGRKELNMSDAEVKLRLDNLDTRLNAQFR